MSRDGSGNYSLPSPANPVVGGTNISSVDFNNTMSDVAAALTGSVAADGQTPMTGPLNMSTHAISGVTTLDATGAMTAASLAATGAVTAASMAATGNITAANGTSGTQVVNASQFGSSFGASSSYVKLPNGYIRQFGTATSDGTGLAAITFPITFPTAIRAWGATITVSGFGSSIIAQVGAKGNGSMNVLTVAPTTGAGIATGTFSWWAEGN